jgi:hypothetical protein
LTRHVTPDSVHEAVPLTAAFAGAATKGMAASVAANRQTLSRITFWVRVQKIAIDPWRRSFTKICG